MDWDSLKSVFQVILVPLLGIFGYHYKRHLDQLDEMNYEMTTLKIENASTKTQLINITEQLKDLKELVNVVISKLENKRR